MSLILIDLTTQGEESCNGKNGKTILNGRYEIIRPIGYGGMAEVFLAHDQLLDRNVAVKMLRDQFLGDNELLEQFRREAKSAARLGASVYYQYL